MDNVGNGGVGSLPEMDLLPADQISTPIVVTGSLTKAQALVYLAQAIAAMGGIVTLLGIGDISWVVRTMRFLHSNEAIPVLGGVAWAMSAIAFGWRARKKKIERAVLAYMVHNRVGKLEGKVAPAVAKAIEAATIARTGR